MLPASFEPSPASVPLTGDVHPNRLRAGRHRWVVALAALAILGGAVLLFSGSLTVAFVTAFRASDAYQTAYGFVTAHPLVTERLGEPLHDGWRPEGRIERNGRFGKARLSFRLRGPRGKGTARVLSHRDGARWIVDDAQIEIGADVLALTP